MTRVLGRDVKSGFAARLAGRLFPITVTKMTPGTYDYNNPGVGTQPTSVDYTCEGMSFAYQELLTDGEETTRALYRVMMLLGSFKLAGVPVDAIEITTGDIIRAPRPGSSTPANATVESVQSVSQVAVTVIVGGLDG